VRRTVAARRIWERGTEWDAVRALLAREARTAMGRERALTAPLLTDVAAVHAALEATGQARLALAAGGPPPLDGLPDVRDLLDRASAEGSVLEGAELVLLLPLLDAAPRLEGYGRGVEAVAPEIAARLRGLPRLGELRARLGRALDDTGGLTDEASPRLGQLRRDVRTRRQRIVADLERALAGPDADRLFADRFVTVRHGRYVLPVRAEARSRVRGIVHDRSQSGQTLFVEPEAVVEANNDLVQRVREEEQESARLLAELTGAVRERLDDLLALIETLGEVDWIFARAAAADRMEATRPLVEAGGPVALHRARHPLLLAQSWDAPDRAVVPVDLLLAPERPILLVTGPNAGGKTIALKTLGLLALMVRVGCHVPAAEGSRLPLVERLFAVVGDDQSVAENLSTFSAFVRQVREILAEADARSLVLLDELGAGTDPDEGAALGQAILEALDARGALVMATTHLEPLRVFASTHPRARNASVEFDTATLAPTFRLVYDRPGPSYALAIAARLGLGSELIRRAQAHRSEQAARLAELLTRLDAVSRTEAERVRALEAQETEAAARLGAARDKEAAAEARARDVLARARADATALVADIRRALNAEWERLKRAERSLSSVQESRRRVQEAAARIQPLPPLPAEADPDAVPTPGTSVVAEHLGLRGELVGVTGAMATVQAGAVTVRVPLRALRRADGSGRAEGPPARGSGGPEGRPARRQGSPERALSAEILLLGRTTDEARDLVEKYLDDAFVAGLPSVRVIHGKGTGALRKAVRALLAGHPLVASFRDGAPSEGGAGATVAALKVS
jgi:DNA mismatch repair protein MutS2